MVPEVAKRVGAPVGLARVCGRQRGLGGLGAARRLYGRLLLGEARLVQVVAVLQMLLLLLAPWRARRLLASRGHLLAGPAGTPAGHLRAGRLATGRALGPRLARGTGHLLRAELRLDGQQLVGRLVGGLLRLRLLLLLLLLLRAGQGGEILGLAAGRLREANEVGARGRGRRRRRKAELWRRALRNCFRLLLLFVRV